MNRSLPQSLLVLFVLGVLIAAQQLFALPGGNALWLELQNSMHAPWFFLVVLVLYWWLKGYPLAGRILLVGGIATVIAVGTEFAQSFMPDRSASWDDLLRNAVGGGLGLIFAIALFYKSQNKFRADSSSYGALRLCVAVLAVLALLVFSAWQPWKQLQLQRYRATLLPTIVDFADERSQPSVEVNKGGLLRFGIGNALWPDYEGKGILRLTFGESEYPTLYLKEVMQHWAPYSELVLDVFVLGDDPLALTVGVRYEGSVGTSAYFEKTLPKGASRWTIPRNKFVPDGATGLRVRDVLIYTTSGYAGRGVLLGRFFLQDL